MGAKTSAKFTDAYIRNLKPEPSRYVWDTMLPSFGMYVGKRKKTFVIIQGKGKRSTIGAYPHMTLADARDKARSPLIRRCLRMTTSRSHDQPSRRRRSRGPASHGLHLSTLAALQSYELSA